MKIEHIDAFQIFDSRGTPTIECELTLSSGEKGAGLVPSGASTGQYEAWELRDNDPQLFGGQSVLSAIDNIHSVIAPALINRPITDQQCLDEILIGLDGTENKSRLGANALLAVSMAFARAAAASRRQPLYRYLGTGTSLPRPEIQIIGGGAHADWRTDIQDFMIIATQARTFRKTLEIAFNTYCATKQVMREQGKSSGVADEGGLWPAFDSNEEALETLLAGIRRAGYSPGQEVSLSLDIAASDLYDADTGHYRFGLDGRTFSTDQFRELLEGWCERYPIVAIEDPFADTDWQAWKTFTTNLGSRLQIIGDDLFTTNPRRIGLGIEQQLANSVLIKLNQVGTVSETLQAIRTTQKAGWTPIVSARSGETEDAFIAHLAVGTNAGQLKVGSFTRGERMAKWNEVLRIERQLGDAARFHPGPRH